jgi:hypothetical protein
MRRKGAGSNISHTSTASRQLSPSKRGRGEQDGRKAEGNVIIDCVIDSGTPEIWVPFQIRPYLPDISETLKGTWGVGFTESSGGSPLVQTGGVVAVPSSSELKLNFRST